MFVCVGVDVRACVWNEPLRVGTWGSGVLMRVCGTRARARARVHSDLSGNQLTGALPISMGELVALTELCVCGCAATAAGHGSRAQGCL